MIKLDTGNTELKNLNRLKFSPIFNYCQTFFYIKFGLFGPKKKDPNRSLGIAKILKMMLNSFNWGVHMEENFNIHLGKKLRMRRLSLGLTQTKVAQSINVTFQQIQKYEKGTNGVSSSRLMQLSKYLKVPITYFYEDFRDYKDMNNENSEGDDLNYSFLNKTFSALSKIQKEKILQVLRNTNNIEKSA